MREGETNKQKSKQLVGVGPEISHRNPGTQDKGTLRSDRVCLPYFITTLPTDFSPQSAILSGGLLSCVMFQINDLELSQPPGSHSWQVAELRLDLTWFHSTRGFFSDYHFSLETPRFGPPWSSAEKTTFLCYTLFVFFSYYIHTYLEERRKTKDYPTLCPHLKMHNNVQFCCQQGVWLAEFSTSPFPSSSILSRKEYSKPWKGQAEHKFTSPPHPILQPLSTKIPRAAQTQHVKPLTQISNYCAALSTAATQGQNCLAT
jgi:hypothetical protein